MKLYEFAPTRSIRVRWTLQELGIDFEAIPVDLLAGEHRSPAFLKINPAGKLPVLVDGDMVLTESIAIVLYLAEKYRDKGLIPADLQQRAQLGGGCASRPPSSSSRSGELPAIRRFIRRTSDCPANWRLRARISRKWRVSWTSTCAADNTSWEIPRRLRTSCSPTRSTGQRWRECSMASRGSRLTWTTCTRGHARRCALKKPSPASSADLLLRQNRPLLGRHPDRDRPHRRAGISL